MRRLLVALTVACASASFAAAAAEIAGVGSIAFPTSGAPEAQRHFLRGVAILHSFGWKQAIAEFREAQALDEDFAMAYWGESLCYNHPLMAERDRATPTEVLHRLGETSEERAAKAPTEREKGFVAAVEARFLGGGDTAQRRAAYMQAMRRLYERYPDDHEVAAFYALSLLSAAGPVGDEGLPDRVLAGSIALQVFGENPAHPGAAHYVIHAFDDPVHAPLALPAARTFAKIAPAVSHARHMPSHIFIQRGMWKEVSRSNQSAYEAAVALWEPGDSAGDMVHALDWGQYGDLQLRDFERARQWIARLEGIAEKAGEQAFVADALPRVKARYVLSTREWQTQPVTAASSADELLATGLSAVELGDLELARRAEARLAELAAQAADEEASYIGRSGKPTQIMHREVAAAVRWAEGRRDEALALLREGAAIAETLPDPRGPANPIVPVHELLGEKLLASGRAEQAVEMFEASLARTPNRPRSVLGLARASAEAGDALAAAEHWARLAEIWEGGDFPERTEATPAVGASEARSF